MQPLEWGVRFLLLWRLSESGWQFLCTEAGDVSPLLSLMVVLDTWMQLLSSRVSITTILLSLLVKLLQLQSVQSTYQCS